MKIIREHCKVLSVLTAQSFGLENHYIAICRAIYNTCLYSIISIMAVFLALFICLSSIRLFYEMEDNETRDNLRKSSRDK